MTTRLLFAALAAVTLALPAFCQDSGSDGSSPAPAAAGPHASDPSQPDAKAPDGSAGGPTAGAAKDAEADAPSADGRLYIRLDKGGEVIFKPVSGKAAAEAGAAGKAAGKIKYKGYAKKGLNKYKKAAAQKRLDKDALDSLAPKDAAKAKMLAAEAEMNADVEDTLKQKLQAADQDAGQGDQKEKLMAAADSAQKTGRNLKRKMQAFEQNEAGGKKVFKDPAQAAGDSDGSAAQPASGADSVPADKPAAPDNDPNK